MAGPKVSIIKRFHCMSQHTLCLAVVTMVLCSTNHLTILPIIFTCMTSTSVVLLPCFAIVTCEAQERLRREKQII